MFQSYRANDAVITICQDNARQSIEIREMNAPAEEVMGYCSSQVAGRPLAHFLPDRIRTLLEEYVEFEEDGNDVGSVLSKVQSFCVVDDKGREVAFRLKVLRSESLDKNAYFRLILQDRAGERKTEAFRAILRENFKGHEVLDPDTHLPDRNSMVKNLELVHHYVVKEAVRACFAVLEVDQYENIRARHGEEACHSLVKHLASLARQSLRSDDTIGSIGPGRLGILLMDTNTESARMVLNRLRWLMAATPGTPAGKETVPATVSIAFAKVQGDSEDRHLLPKLESSLSTGNGTGNALIETAA